jgi:hypothetical protein
MKRISMSGLYTERRSAQGYLCASEETPATGGACGSACGAGDPEPKPATCGSACGAGDK